MQQEHGALGTGIKVMPVSFQQLYLPIATDRILVVPPRLERLKICQLT